MRTAAGEIDGGTLYVTGTPAVTADLDPVFAEDIKKGEFYIAIPIALLILLFVFGTLSVSCRSSSRGRDPDDARDRLDLRAASWSSRPTSRTW